MDHSYTAHGPVFESASSVLPRWFEGDFGPADPPRLCSVDHENADRRRAVEEAERMSSQLLLRHPLPPGDRKVVELLPVMRRIAVREAVMVDKVRQRAEHIRTQLREEAEHRFHVHRASAGSTRRRRSTSGAFGP